MLNTDFILKRFDNPDELKTFHKSTFKLLEIGGMTIGEIVEMHPGDVFYVPPSPHDSWVVGDELYVSLQFRGAASCAQK